MDIKKILFLLIALFAACPALSADWNKIEGIYAVTPENYIDPAPTEQADSHYRIQLKGNAARDMYHAIKIEPVTDECTSGMAKNIDAMQCLYFENSNTYECHFSIKLQTQEIEYGVAC